jgi:hypothetical protein
MSHLKEHVKKVGIRYFLTYADNFAVGYFRKQVIFFYYDFIYTTPAYKQTLQLYLLTLFYCRVSHKK